MERPPSWWPGTHDYRIWQGWCRLVEQDPEKFTPGTHQGEAGWLWEGAAETLIRKAAQDISDRDLQIAWAVLQNKGQLVNLETERPVRRIPSDPPSYDYELARAVDQKWFIRRDFYLFGAVRTTDGTWGTVVFHPDGTQENRFPARDAGRPVPADEGRTAERERLRAENSRLKDGLRQIARQVAELLAEPGE
jgi:hypothetical protein